MSVAPSPRRLARRLLQHAVPDETRDAADGDLHELFVARHAASGTVAAAIWYWLETLSFLMRYSIERVMRGIRGVAGGNAAPSTLDLELCGSDARQVVVGLIAAAGPARRGLRVQPTEALRGE